MKLHSNQKSLL